ncbi:MAG: hypothetical protein HW400_102 [Candidatus Levybacteria bacterium]|nr:hypothetical protein [Candidatus Levybacteria bacterium]
MNISFFARPASWDDIRHRLNCGVSVIRGKQIAKYLGAKLNPKSGYDNDICIYVKPGINTQFAKHSYIDVMDVDKETVMEFNKLDIPMILSSLFAYEIFSKAYRNSRFIFIPQHHCNYGRIKRNRKKITTVGILGYHASFQYPIEDVRKRLKKIGMELLFENKILDRLDAVNFYKKIDIQIVWIRHAWMTKNAMKLYNAASFGIPTIGYRRSEYKEFEGYYIPVETIEELIEEVKKLKDSNQYYAQYADKIVNKAEDYHISKIAELYKRLE